jgi:hypothetical protein
LQYFYWPLKRYQQLFNVATDPYEERDVMNTTSLALLRSIKARYAYLKSLSQNGGLV